MNNELINVQIYTNEEFGEVRALEINGEPWFVGKDVAEKLGYTRPNDSITDHIDEDDRIMMDKTQRQNGVEFDYKLLGQRGGWIINESGLYSLILSSKLPDAKKFKKWVTGEILPSIRKTGSYGVPEISPEQQKANLLLSIYNGGQEGVLASKMLTEMETKPLLEQLEEQKPKVAFADTVQNSDSCFDMSELAGIISSQLEISIGRNKLFKLLRDKGYLRQNNIPYQQYIDQGLFKVIQVAKGSNVYEKTLVTGKGEVYFINKIKKWFDVKEKEVEIDFSLIANNSINVMI